MGRHSSDEARRRRATGGRVALAIGGAVLAIGLVPLLVGAARERSPAPAEPPAAATATSANGQPFDWSAGLPAERPPPSEASTYRSHVKAPFFEPTRVDAHGVTCSYGYAVFGSLKYGPDFTHFDYVNPDAPKGGTYRYAMAQSSFDTLSQYSLLGTFPLSLIYFHDTLMKPSADEPASSYGNIADRVCYPKDLSWVEFHINPAARWNDGKPLTVEDVLFTFRIAKTTIGIIQRRIDTAVTGAERTGPESVRFYMAQANNPTFPTMVVNLAVLPKHYYEHRDFTASSLEPPVNTGPYRIGRLSPGRWIDFVRVENYWAKDWPVNKGRYNFAVLREDYYRDAEVANQAFLAGNEDAKMETIATNFAAEERLPAFRAGEVKRGLIRYTQPSFYNGIIMNTRRPFLSDRAVRHALMLCFDYEWMNRVLFDGRFGRLTSYFPNSEFAAHGLPDAAELALLEPHRDQIPPEVFTRPVGLPVGGDWTKRRANLLEAQGILRAAGYRVTDGRLVDGRGRPVRLTLLAYSPLVDRQVSLFIANARKLGIEIAFRSVDSAQFRHMTRHYDYDFMAGVPTLATSETPGVGFLQMWSSKAADTPQQLNYAGAKNPAIDALITKLIAAKDRGDVVTTMRALDRIFQWSYYAIPAQHQYPSPVGYLPVTYWDRFGRPKTEPNRNFQIMTLDNWWIDEARQARLTHWRPQ